MNHQTLSKVKKDFQLDIPDKTVFRRDANLISFDHDKSTISYTLKNGGMEAHLRVHKKYSHTLERHLDRILRFLEDFAALKEARFLKIKLSDYITINKGVNDSQLSTYRYLPRRTPENEIYTSLFSYDYTFPYVKILDETWEATVINMYACLEHRLQKQKEKDPTFDFSFDKNFSLHSLQFYHCGYEGKIRFSIYPGAVHQLSSPLGEEHTFQSNEELLSILDSLFETIYRKQRILNVYQPPNYHFKRFLDSLSLKNIAGDQVYQEMLQYATADRIEQLMIHPPKVHSVTFSAIASYVFSFEQATFILNRNSGKIYSTTDENVLKKMHEENLSYSVYLAYLQTFNRMKEQTQAILSHLHQLQAGMNTHEYVNQDTISSTMKYDDIQLFKFLNVFVVSFKEEVKTFELTNLSEAFSFFCSLVTERSVMDHPLTLIPN